MRRLSFVFIFIVAVIIIILGAIYLILNQNSKTISSFEECVQAGYPVMESYPAVCMTPDKRMFTQELSAEELENKSPAGQPLCKNSCGDSICQSVVCQGEGCLCAETESTCPNDCYEEKEYREIPPPSTLFNEINP